jgi:[histone H3]-trimethyl-L-lysine4 demethylase
MMTPICFYVTVVTAVSQRISCLTVVVDRAVLYSGFHIYCLDPPLQSIPKGQWYCHTCLFGTGQDFGFDEGEEHSLASFQARDIEFRRRWFESHPPLDSTNKCDDDAPFNIIGNIRVSEFDVEKEFWRLVQSPYETVEIEYGADVHSTTHGRYVFAILKEFSHDS